MKNFGLLELLILILALLVILAIFVVAIAIVFPSSTQQIISQIRDDPELQDSTPVKVISGVTKRGGEGFNSRIRPAAEYIGDLFKREKGAEDRKIAEAEPAPPKIDFKGCISDECHLGLFERKAFNNIYVDHRIHQVESVECYDCHKDNEHPKPKRVDQETCIVCHEEREAATNCGTCHTPGSILSNEVIYHTTIEEFLTGRISSSIVPKGFEHPVGEIRNICKNCHDVPQFCDRCHNMFHKAIPTWLSTHGKRVISGELSMPLCWNCHNANWCATTCHSNAPSKQRRTVPPLKLPKVTLPR